MARSAREKFLRQVELIKQIDDAEVRAALLDFADAADPEIPDPEVPKPDGSGGVKKHKTLSNNSAASYLGYCRNAHDRGLKLLGADPETVNRFMSDLTAEPDRRRYDLVEHDGSITEDSAGNWQAGLIAFYRFCAEPARSDGRPDVAVEWPADDIRLYSRDSSPKDPEEFPDDDDLDAMREACLNSQNTRRDRAFLELAAGTGQRLTAILTLRVGDVNLEGTDRFEHPHILLNPEIGNGNGAKGAIANGGRLRPIVTDTGPIRQWLKHHPLSDGETRKRVGAPEKFEDCYVFLGSLGQRTTDASDHWAPSSANAMLSRRKSDTANLPGHTVEVSVNPHQWRHLAYTKSEKLPISEAVRRKMFGWAPGSDTGETLYGHTKSEEAAEEFAEAWSEAFDDGDAEGVVEAVVGGVSVADLPPEKKRALVDLILGDDRTQQHLRQAAEAALADADG